MPLVGDGKTSTQALYTQHQPGKLCKPCVVGAGSDSVCLATGVLLWRGGLSAGRLTQRIAATWVRIPAMAPATFGVSQKSLRRLQTDCTALFLLGISGWTPRAGQGGPKSWAKADHDRESRRTTIEGQGGPSTRGVKVKAGQDRGSRRATIGVRAGSDGGPRRTGTTQK